MKRLKLAASQDISRTYVLLIVYPSKAMGVRQDTGLNKNYWQKIQTPVLIIHGLLKNGIKIEKYKEGKDKGKLIWKCQFLQQEK